MSPWRITIEGFCLKIKNNIFPNLPDRIAGLGELAENLWWSWHSAARMLFKILDKAAMEGESS